MSLIVSIATVVSALCDVFGILKPWLLPLTERPIAWMVVHFSQGRGRTFIQLLKDKDPRKRQLAGRILCRIGAPVVPLLIDAIGDMANGTLREEASRVLPRIGLPAIRPMIVARYTNYEAQNRVAFDLLGDALYRLDKSQAVINHLLELLTVTDSDWQIRQGSVFALGALRDVQAVKPLCHILGSADSERLEVRQEAALALGTIGNTAARPRLIQTLCGDVDWRVRAAAAEALGEIRGIETVTPLIAALEDDRRVAEKAATALGVIGDDEAVAPLINALRRPEPKVRETVARALGEIGSVEAISALLQRIEEDVDENVRHFATEALIAIDTGKAILELEEAPSRVSEEPIQDRLSLIYRARDRIKQDMRKRRSGYAGFDVQF